MINLRHDILAINGYTSIPTNIKATANEQFLFVNNALGIAYQDYLARDRHLVVVIFMQIYQQLVDVNVRNLLVLLFVMLCLLLAIEHHKSR